MGSSIDTLIFLSIIRNNFYFSIISSLFSPFVNYFSVLLSYLLIKSCLLHCPIHLPSCVFFLYPRICRNCCLISRIIFLSFSFVPVNCPCYSCSESCYRMWCKMFDCWCAKLSAMYNTYSSTIWAFPVSYFFCVLCVPIDEKNKIKFDRVFVEK